MTAKQNDAIAMLTQDHREAAELFKQFEELGDGKGAAKKKQAIVEQVCTALTLHTMLEEEIFYPAVRDEVTEAEDLLDEAQVEHASAKDLIAQLQEMEPGDELYDAKVKVLGEQVQHHVKEEEKEMFPKVKKSGLDLEALGEEMRARREEISATL